MAIDKDTNKLSTTNASGEPAANRYRTTFSAADSSVADGLTTTPAVPSGQRTDFTDVPNLIDEMYQNVADGYIGRMTVPGGATIRVTELTGPTTLAVMPDGARRRTSNGDWVEVNGAYLYLPINGEGRGAEDVDDTVDRAKRAIKIVVARAQKAKLEQDARETFDAMQADPVDLSGWAAGEDVDADALVKAELSAARLGYRGHNFGDIADLRRWVPGAEADEDRLVRDELENYRGFHGN